MLSSCSTDIPTPKSKMVTGIFHLLFKKNAFLSFLLMLKSEGTFREFQISGNFIFQEFISFSKYVTQKRKKIEFYNCPKLFCRK